jgi:predicted ATP-binding protein involved in virulence
MRLKRIYVTDLFGTFKHDIPLNLEDRITIIHGPNGFGKTAVLKMLHALFNSRFSLLRSIPFSQFQVSLDDDSTVDVLRFRSSTQPDNYALTISYSRQGREVGRFETSQPELLENFPMSALDDMLPTLRRVAPDAWYDVETGRHLTLEDILDEYGEQLPFPFPDPAQAADWYTRLRSSVGLHLIDTERLRASRQVERRRGVRRGRPPVELAVMRYASELAEMIRSKLAESAALSQSLDRTFPARLVQHGLNKRIADEDIQKRLAALEEKRSRLKATGLLEKDEDMNFQIGTTLDDHTKGVLAVYAEDVEKKLSVFDDIVGRLDLLKTFISGRFLYKRMAISKDNGFVFTTLNGTPLTPADLSSGEQHELVLLYELLFRVRPGSLILIDEPEISLHIAWQEVFLRDLLSITSLSHFDVLIATHSPQIIHDRLDLTVRLKGPDNTTETVQGMPGHSK